MSYFWEDIIVNPWNYVYVYHSCGLTKCVIKHVHTMYTPSFNIRQIEYNRFTHEEILDTVWQEENNCHCFMLSSFHCWIIINQHCNILCTTPNMHGYQQISCFTFNCTPWWSKRFASLQIYWSHLHLSKTNDMLSICRDLALVLILSIFFLYLSFNLNLIWDFLVHFQSCHASYFFTFKNICKVRYFYCMPLTVHWSYL